MAALDANKSDPEVIAERAFLFEILIGNSSGRQDQYMAALGGFNHLTFDGVGARKVDLNITFETRKDNLLLFYSSIPHDSGKLHDGIWDRYADGDGTVTSALLTLKDVARVMARALTSGDFPAVG